MANEQLVEIILNHGTTRWNLWREENAGIPDLAGAKLQGVGLMRGDFVNANLEGANLKGSNLAGANFTSANLRGANLAGADLQGAILSDADLTDADLRSANLRGANFEGAIVTPNTMGMRNLTLEQQQQLRFVGDGDETDNSSEESDSREPGYADDVTVVNATRVVGPASSILETLATPNEPDFTEEHRELIRELQRIVSELNAELGKVADQDRRLSDEPEVLRKVQEAMPVWRITWQTFIGSAAGSLAGHGTAFAAGYTAGFIAGVLHDTFSPAESCLL